MFRYKKSKGKIVYDAVNVFNSTYLVIFVYAVEFFIN